MTALGSAAATWPLVARAQQPAAVAPSGNNTDKIRPFDVLDVTVFKVPDLSKNVKVDGAGTIIYPLIGEIPAAGKTPHDTRTRFRTAACRQIPALASNHRRHKGTQQPVAPAQTDQRLRVACQPTEASGAESVEAK